jgi:hypothetical protein
MSQVSNEGAKSINPDIIHSKWSGALVMVSAHFVSIAWPILLIIIGIKKMCAGMCGCCQKKM